MGSNNLFRLGLTEAALAYGYLYANGFDQPQCSYRDHAERKATSTGGVAEYGSASVVLTWSNLSRTQVAYLERLVGDGNKTMYATIDRLNGKSGAHDWIDVYGIVHPMLVDPIPGTSGRAYANVTITINNLTTANDPSAVS